MSKPTNLPEKNCTAISSNCVVWDGPNIDCIGLCKGQSVTKVVYTLGLKVCELQEKLSVFDVDNYDLYSMPSEYGPVLDFKTMMQNLITKAFSPQ